MMQDLDKLQLRRHLRACRNQLSDSDQKRASRKVLRQLNRLLAFRKARRIATYLATDGELDPGDLRGTPGKAWYLPKLDAIRRNRLLFLPWQGRLRQNRYGIAEPTVLHLQRPPRHLDIILVPLVGFDRLGTRLGMGGGYYDRTLSYRKRTGCWKRPHLIGIAHACQQVDHISRATWDIGLDLIVTDRNIFSGTLAEDSDG